MPTIPPRLRRLQLQRRRQQLQLPLPRLPVAAPLKRLQHLLHSILQALLEKKSACCQQQAHQRQRRDARAQAISSKKSFPMAMMSNTACTCIITAMRMLTAWQIRVRLLMAVLPGQVRVLHQPLWLSLPLRIAAQRKLLWTRRSRLPQLQRHAGQLWRNSNNRSLSRNLLLQHGRRCPDVCSRQLLALQLVPRRQRLGAS